MFTFLVNSNFFNVTLSSTTEWNNNSPACLLLNIDNFLTVIIIIIKHDWKKENMLERIRRISVHKIRMYRWRQKQAQMDIADSERKKERKKERNEQ